MTSYLAMGERGREAAWERTVGRRKPIVIRLDYSDTPEPGGPPGSFVIAAALVGKCGHVLKRERWIRYVDPRYPELSSGNWRLEALARRVGRRMTCEHDDCRITR